MIFYFFKFLPGICWIFLFPCTWKRWSFETLDKKWLLQYCSSCFSLSKLCQSCVQFFVTVWSAAAWASLSFTVSWSLLKLTSIQLAMPSNPLILVACFFSCSQTFPAKGSFPRSWLFTSGGQSIGVSASASVLPMNIQGWFSFRIYWFDLFAVQGTLKSFLQHRNSKTSILWCSAFFWSSSLICTWLLENP